MVKIRLARYGRKKSAFYRIVAVDSRKKREGSVLEILGFWNPAKGTKEIDKESLNTFVKKGAVISPGVAKLLG